MPSISRRCFLKGLGALALTAAASCRRAQKYAVPLEDAPEWLLPGEATCFATSMPWATGAIPLVAVCHDGVPTSLQPNPYFDEPGLPAFVQASILDLYNPERLAAPEEHGRAWSWKGVRAALRAWSQALRDGRNVGFLFPAGHSFLRAALVEELEVYAGARFYAWDVAAGPRIETFSQLDKVITSAFGPAEDTGSPYNSLSELIKELPHLDALFIFTPADIVALVPEFAAALLETNTEVIRFSSLGRDKTALASQYIIPQTHYLEEWGADAGSCGWLCLRQPVTLPLRPAVSEAEILLALARGELTESAATGSSIVKEYLLQLYPDFDGLVSIGALEGEGETPTILPTVDDKQSPIAFFLHPYFADGRFCHNAWLRETYDPISGFAGAPSAFVPGEEAGVVTVRTPAFEIPGWVVPGLTRPCLPMLPGYRNLKLEDITVLPGATWPHRSAAPLPTEVPSKPIADTGTWHLVIDLSACIGCGACTVACRAENNVPTVGEEDLQHGRDIQWLRIDRYLDQQKNLHYVPAACRHCQNAPCEAVCPVNATVHTSEGINAMVYARCWGTRYCAAACPYQARHFNFRDYALASQRSTHLPPNPKVTVRGRGVMEKCNYCTQLINQARAAIREPHTACELACPTQAIRLTRILPKEPIDFRFDVADTLPSTLYVRSK